VILRQNKRNPVTNAAEFAKLVKQFQSDKTILFLVERGDSRILLTVKNR
jgi:hypothetical protein